VQWKNIAQFLGIRMEMQIFTRPEKRCTLPPWLSLPDSLKKPFMWCTAKLPPFPNRTPPSGHPDNLVPAIPPPYFFAEGLESTFW
jgi:hypothetical protein